MKAYDTGLIVGRFQTLHIGHQKLIDTARSLCDRVLILVGSAQESGTIRNPLNIKTRMDMIKEVYPDQNIMIYALPDLTNENDISTDWGRYVLDNCERYIHKSPEVFVFGNDTNTGSSWFDDADMLNTSQMIVSRGTIPISATQLREMMVYGDSKRKEWMQWVSPRLHKKYDEIKAELMSIKYYQELQEKLIKEVI